MENAFTAIEKSHSAQTKSYLPFIAILMKQVKTVIWRNERPQLVFSAGILTWHFW